MSRMSRLASHFSSRANGLACVVVLLCVCIIAQMLGAPFTLLGLMDSDVLTESEPVSEDVMALSSSPEPERPRLFHVLADSSSVLHLPVLLTSVFRPPLV